MTLSPFPAGNGSMRFLAFRARRRFHPFAEADTADNVSHNASKRKDANFKRHVAVPYQSLATTISREDSSSRLISPASACNKGG